MGFAGNIVFDTSKSDGQFKKTASNKKLKELYPEFQFTPIQEVLRINNSKILFNVQSNSGNSRGFDGPANGSLKITKQLVKGIK